MGHNIYIGCTLALVLCVHISAVPYADENEFLRSAVETIPPHHHLATPVRASVESIPPRNLRDEGDERLPLRDAVEKRPINTPDRESLYRFIEDAENLGEDIPGLRKYYGAATYLNSGNRNDERLQQGNANLQEMQQTASGPAGRKLVVCYMESWAAYRAPPLAFTAGLVPKSCTHLHYAFATLHPHTYTVLPTNEDYDIIKGGYRIATGLKRRVPGLKVLISVGGIGTGRLFSEMVKAPTRRKAFVDSAIDFLREHDFDGLDLHWKYPGEKDENEKDHLTSLLYELREKFSSYGLLLSTVLPPFRYQIEDGYDISAVSGATDYAILQGWDMTHRNRDEAPTRAHQHSPLHRDPGADYRDQKYDNIEFMVRLIIRRGMAAEKLILGVPLFGRSYTLSPDTAPAPGASVSGWGDEGKYTQTKGLLAFFEICMMLQDGKVSSSIDEDGNAYAVFGDQWVSYDSPITVVEKMKFVISSGLGGAAAYAIDMDDFRGLCGSPFSILSAISISLNGEAVQSDQSSLKIGSCEADGAYLSSDEVSCAHFHFCTGGTNYKLVCEDERLYDPSTGFCGHQDVAKCIPGQSLRISVDDATRYLTQAYDSDFEWNGQTIKEIMMNNEPERLKDEYGELDTKKSRDNDKRLVCYMTSWSFYRRGDGKFVPEHIDSRLCTHIVYAYATLTPDELVAKEFDPWTDITNNLYERVTSQKDVKVLLGLGGWTDSAGDKYSRLVSSGANRSKFIQRAIAFLRNNNFKGLHLDWNYPVCWQSNCKKGAVSDKANFAKFVQELSKALHNANMELGVSLSGYKEVIDAAYDLPAISDAADFLSTMTYDYHGGWERTTAHHTPLTSSARDPLGYYSIEYAIKSLISGGADPKKILLGLSFYGQSYRLADSQGSKGVGAAAAGPGEPGEFTKQPGMLAYYEICYRVKNLRWKTDRQDKAGPFAYSDSQWVGYDDPQSIKEKVEWALRQGLGGVTAWAMDLDDFNNRCCNEPSPLLRAAGRALGKSVPPPPTSACERPPPPVTPAPPTTTTVAADGSMGGAAPGHDHGGHGSHGDHTSTTWPSWNPEPSTSTTPSTAMTWWPQASTTTTTTTKRPTTTTTTTTTTTRRPTTTRKPTTSADTGIEGSSCRAGEYKAAPGDCESYLQCEGGQWRKSRCAPGLHWSAKETRCDWPSFAKCSESSTSQSSPATSTLAPMTSRPPPPSSTTRKPTTTTTTTTTTTRRPFTTTTTTESAAVGSDGAAEGEPCSGQGEDYIGVANDCNAYLHCDGTWKMQKCAPGLHWSQAQKHCDWPKYAKCEGSEATSPKPVRPQRPSRPTTSPSNKPVEDGVCQSSDSHASSNACDSYLLCVSGRWKKQNCPPGLHWDDRSKRCDWVEFAMCDMKTNPTKTPLTTRRPSMRPTTSTRKPAVQADNPMKPGMSCRTGSYHAHPRCDKFLVCVNGMLVAQSCAPGLVWNTKVAQCDFPSSTSCSDKRLTGGSPGTMEQLTMCDTGSYAPFPGECTRYRHCLYGKYQEFSCSAGLHWNQEKQICDWPKNAKCRKRGNTKPSSVNQIVSPPLKPQHVHETKPVITKPIATTTSTTTAPFQDEYHNSLLKSPYKLVCYYTNWAWYRPGLGQYGPEDIDPSLCTHIVYGFAVLGDDGLITAHDPWADNDNRFYERVVEYKRYGIKVSLALGGWNDSAGDKYSKLVNNPEAREKFVTHALDFIQQYGFDGLDLDWEYPKCWQVDCSKGPDSDKEGFASLVRELSAVFKPKGLLLSSAVSPNKKVIDAGYDVPVLAKHLDWIAVMTYDFHGQWDKKTGHVAPLYYHPDDDTTYFNANYSMNYWMLKGAPASKLIMGMPMYGQTFTLDTKGRRNATGLNVPAISGGEMGEYTRAKGFLAYYEICERIKDKGWMVQKDPLGRMGPYAYKGDQWVSYDDMDILKSKVNLIKTMELGGGMVWALDLDDFRNRCGQGKHPLLNTIKQGLLDPKIYKETIIISKPINNFLNDDLEDIEVIPSYTKKTTTTPRPEATTQLAPMHTTRKPVKPAAEERYKVVCYYTNWAWYRPDSGKYSPSDIDPSLCTHIVYAFAVLDSSKLIIKPHDVFLDVENKFYEKVVALKRHGVKVLLGLGGWNDSAGDKYSRLVNSPSARRTFIVHALDFIEQFEFDGLDLDWEYPKCWQVECENGPSSDKQGFASLVKELKSAFTPRGLLLSAAVSPSKRVIDEGYDVPVLSKNLDWIAVMAYDYHGQWDKKTGHVSPMYVSDKDEHKTFNVNFTMHYYMQKGASRRKLIMGVPMYGQSFSLVEHAGAGLGAPAYAGGEAGDETRARGFLAFYEICERIRSRGWKVTRDPGGRMGPYATLDDQWVSFDDDSMIRHKAEYIREMGLGGSMIWSLDLDDFTGKYCGCGKAPLLQNINHVLRGKEAPPHCSLKEIEVPESEQSSMGVPASRPESSTERDEPEPEPMIPAVEEVPDVPEVPDSEQNELSLDGKQCSGIRFAADATQCNKYYLCMAGHYVELTCPEGMYWNKNHCDLPSNSNCRSRAQLRLSNEENAEEVVEKPIIACYFTNWAYYREGSGRYGPEQVDATLCTHIIYTWAHLDFNSSEVIPGNPELDLENDFYGKITEQRLAGVKVIIGVGGLEDSEDNEWCMLAQMPAKRKMFVESVIRFLKRWNFDGMQLAWQYPVCKQVPCETVDLEDRDNFNMLLVELAKSMRPLGYELSAMVAASPEIAALAYDTEILMASVDWVAVAANDYYASKTGRTSYLVSLESREDSSVKSFNSTLAYWLSVMPRRQLVVGVPAYARSYTLRRPSAGAAPGDVASGPGQPGPYTDVPGFLAYSEICTNIKSHKWTETRTADGTYAQSSSQWASYLRPEEVSRIADSLHAARARGAALWALDLDDWRGHCSCRSHPLLRALRRGLLQLDTEMC
ncbi:unnamed protein product [Plutella xylostella]|uniref:chitinase n=1 Tax=Plutella xylostella TaxID=51655 RepID=A0A8S4DG43_PLUXY|nr:unnamed protein product [Plutella xylostella]